MLRQLELQNKIEQYILDNNIDAVKKLLNNNKSIRCSSSVYIAIRNSNNRVLNLLLNSTEVSFIVIGHALNIAIQSYNIDAIKLILKHKNAKYVFNYKSIFKKLNTFDDEDDIKNKKQEILELLLSDKTFLKYLMRQINNQYYVITDIPYNYKKQFYYNIKRHFNKVPNVLLNDLFDGACRYGELNFVKELIEKEDMSRSVEYGIKIAMYYNKLNIIEYLLNNRNIDFIKLDTIIPVLTHSKHKDAFEIFLNDGRFLRYLNYNELSLYAKKAIKKYYNFKSLNELELALNVVR